MPQANYPARADLVQYLADQGVTETVSDTRLDQALASAISAFERAVDRKMLADAVATPDTFSPPPDRSGLLPLPDFISVASVVYAPQNSTPETFALITDYTLQPTGALGISGPYAPYSALAFTRFWPQPMGPALQGSLTITARWGYADALPDDVWEAMLGRAAGRLLVPLGVARSGGSNSWSEGGGSESIAIGSQGYYSGQLPVLREQWNDAVMQYRRWTV